MSAKGDTRYELWKFFSDEYGLTLTEGQLNDIVREVEKYQKVNDEVLNIPVVPPRLQLYNMTIDKPDNDNEFKMILNYSHNVYYLDTEEAKKIIDFFICYLNEE